MFDVRGLRSCVLRMMAALVLSTGFAALPAQAEVRLVERSGLIGGAETIVTPFSVPGAGTLSVTLTDLGWPTRLQTLSFALSDATTVLGRMSAPGTQSFTVGGAANLFAHVYGMGATPLDLGLYSLRVQFTPVPLPSAAVLMMLGVGLFAAMRDPRLRSLTPQGVPPQPA